MNLPLSIFFGDFFMKFGYFLSPFVADSLSDSEGSTTD